MTLFIFITGGSGSGKSQLAQELQAYYASCTALNMDDYYLPKPADEEEAKKRNFDIPEALDLKLLAEHIILLSQGKPIEKPRYSKALSDRLPGTETVNPADVILVEGLFSFSTLQYLPRDFKAKKVYVESIQLNDNTCRRLSRDDANGGGANSPAQLRVMREGFFKYVAPEKGNADIVITNHWRDGQLPQPLLKQYLKASNAPNRTINLSA